MPLTMTLDDKEFTLSDECLVAMATTLWHTKVKERGLMLCVEPSKMGEITPGAEHIGGPSSITVRNCGKKARVGDYHTHPSDGGLSEPSWGDAYSIMSQSYSYKKPWLGCCGGKSDETIRCETVKRVPTLPELQHLRKKRPKMRYSWARDDPEIAEYLTKEYSFPVRKVPEIIKPPAPPPAIPRIKTEELVFAESRFKRYVNLDTGETRIERVY